MFGAASVDSRLKSQNKTGCWCMYVCSLTNLHVQTDWEKNNNTEMYSKLWSALRFVSWTKPVNWWVQTLFFPCHFNTNQSVCFPTLRLFIHSLCLAIFYMADFNPSSVVPPMHPSVHPSPVPAAHTEQEADRWVVCHGRTLFHTHTGPSPRRLWTAGGNPGSQRRGLVK